MPVTRARLAFAATLLFQIPLLGPAVSMALLPTAAQAQTRSMLSGVTFVETAGISNLFEMESSALALKKSENPQIRAYAERMSRDHAEIMSRLKSAAAEAYGQIPIPTELDARHEAMIEKLNAAQGTDFDMLYVQLQTQAHHAAVGVYAAYATDGDQSVLKSFAEKTVPVLREHLDAIKAFEVKT
ncbi:DUF4142 domain-containing protein [Aquabacter spiritensis]|uniref:Putative membrane protein n=1 Tax=Aquabacter spiritensis TaxID=933073 RepID=A0A4R3LQB3_9HYPH|nr:DUF4142 domain-containing protein [Aquabacter spiritensis]TCT02411.1 putative membrane protein [Aquabacter spiritensis]